jgi:hypothetical protein
MALPRMDSVTYTLKLPSSAEEVKYRPFTVKEQKALLLANESEDNAQVQEAIGNVISNCTFEKIDPWVLPSFDVEYVFLQVRSKSVGETVDIQVTCPDDNETMVPTKIDLSKVNVEMHVGHTNEIDITDTIKIIMKYPTLKDLGRIQQFNSSETGQLFELVETCIYQVIDGEEIHQDVDMGKEDLNGFIESLTNPQFEKITAFFETMPKLSHVVKVKNPNTGKSGEVVLEGFQSFFE